MDALKGLLNARKQEIKQVAGEKKYVNRAALEEQKLKRIREEEERERAEKDKKRKLQEEVKAPKQKPAEQQEQQDDVAKQMPKEQVIRRLRALGQPVTLFGEDDYMRFRRLQKAEKEHKVADEALGAELPQNTMLHVQRQEKAQKKADKGKEKEKDKDKTGQEQDPLMAAFQAAAAAVAEKQAEEKLTLEERVTKHIRKWSEDWEKDLEGRSEEVKASASGRHETLVFKQTVANFEPLYKRLKQRQIDPVMREGLWMMVESMLARNYLAALDVYLRLAIGNAPWPIGVTSVGIHERSAREKISHVMNTSGGAHIMNDEATRKYLQGLKRLISFVQRAYPTDPSRSVDFNWNTDTGRGAAGGGSDKQALLEAAAKGELPLALPAAPHYMEQDGSVMVPRKWNQILKRRGLGSDDAPEAQG